MALDFGSALIYTRGAFSQPASASLPVGEHTMSYTRRRWNARERDCDRGKPIEREKETKRGRGMLRERMRYAHEDMESVGDRSSAARSPRTEGIRAVLQLRVPFWILIVRVWCSIFDLLNKHLPPK